MIDSMEPLFNAPIAAVRAASSIDPCSFVRPRSLHDERVLVLPFPYRVAIPPWLRIFGKFSPVRPDYPPCLAKLVQNYHVERRLKDLSCSELVEVFARHSLGIAVDYWIICIRRENASSSIARLMGVQRFQPQRSEG